MIATLPKLILIQLIAIKIQAGIFADFYKMILKFTWKYKGWRAKIILRKNRYEGLYFLISKILQSYSNQENGYWPKVLQLNRQIIVFGNKWSCKNWKSINLKKEEISNTLQHAWTLNTGCYMKFHVRTNHKGANTMWFHTYEVQFIKIKVEW